MGKRLVLDNATFSGVLDRMAEKDWLAKETDQDDKRILGVSLSEKEPQHIPLLVREREGTTKDKQ